MIYAVALLLFAGFVAVQLIALRRRKAALVPDQRLDLDRPADPDPEPAAWPPTR